MKYIIMAFYRIHPFLGPATRVETLSAVVELAIYYLLILQHVKVTCKIISALILLPGHVMIYLWFYITLDIDECLDPGARSQCSNATCINTIGSFNCVCNESFTDEQNPGKCEGNYVI